MKTTPPQPPGDANFDAPLPDNETIRERLAGCPPADIDEVAWLLDYARKNGLSSRAQIARLIGYTASVFSKIFSGNYPSTALRHVARKIRAFKQGAARGDGERFPVSDLRVMKEMHGFMETVWSHRCMGFVFGDNRAGKSVSVREFQRRHPDRRVIYFDMPKGGGTKVTIEGLYRACGFTSKKQMSESEQDIRAFFDPESLLIVDEFHQAWTGRMFKTNTIEFFRKLWDHCQNTVLLVCTHIRTEASGVLSQTVNRAGTMRFTMPARPYREDVARVALDRGFPKIEATDARLVAEIERIAMKQGIGTFCRALDMALPLSAKAERDPQWRDYLAAVATSDYWNDTRRADAADGDSYTVEDGE